MRSCHPDEAASAEPGEGVLGGGADGDLPALHVCLPWALGPLRAPSELSSGASPSALDPGHLSSGALS